MVACLSTNGLAESIATTLVYTYNANGLRVAQSVDGDVTEFAWDWASGLPEMLSDGESVYLVGMDTLGRYDSGAWEYHLPDALGSVRQLVDGAGEVRDIREWSPYGVELGTSQAGLGYTSEWWDSEVGLQYLRARWYAPQVGRFTRRDPWPGDYQQPLMMNPYLYVLASPTMYADPSGYSPEWWERMLKDDTWRTVLFDSTARHNITQMSDHEFAALIAAIIRIESGAVHHRPANYTNVALIKSLEIIYNRTFLPSVLDDTHLGYQTEGISNTSVETIANLRQGLVPDASGNLQHAGIQIHNYNGLLPGLFPFPGLTPGEQFMLRWAVGNFLGLQWLNPPLYDLAYTCISTSVVMQLIRQDQNIEYLAANLEAGAIRAGWEGVQPTAEVLSWWHHRGIVTMRDQDELKVMIANAQDEDLRTWLESIVTAQGEATGYWNLASGIMQDAIGLLSH